MKDVVNYLSEYMLNEECRLGDVSELSKEITEIQSIPHIFKILKNVRSGDVLSLSNAIFNKYKTPFVSVKYKDATLLDVIAYMKEGHSRYVYMYIYHLNHINIHLNHKPYILIIISLFNFMHERLISLSHSLSLIL